MKSRIATIARFTLLEALRTRLPALVLIALALLVTASFFVEQLAIAEGARFQTGFYAASARFAAVFIAAFYVLASITREFNDKGLEIFLALDLPRSHYLLGKLAGFLGIAALLAGAACVPLIWSTSLQALAQWGISLALELGIVIALATFCIITFNQLLPAASFVMGFYLLARTLTAIRLTSANPISGADSISHQVMNWLIEGLALVMPALDSWTQTAWLVNHRGAWTELGWIAAQGMLYIVLLVAAAMFDLYRKNF
jgi:ABC-type transport system involved in multi-copper enzyme maturation permease subunit